VDKYKEIRNDWNYDTRYALTSLPVLDLQNFKHLIFVTHAIFMEIMQFFFDIGVVEISTFSGFEGYNCTLERNSRMEESRKNGNSLMDD
jgi:hypothetical protein